ncbi:MAG: hypothetical protein JW808_08945 [Victivallales bacterium]|nr:hypothetical protein [Victivallales bacterium]
MKVTVHEKAVCVSGFHYAVQISPDGFVLSDPRAGHRLFETSSPLLLRPEFCRCTNKWQDVKLQSEPSDAGAVVVQVTGSTPGGDRLSTTVTCWPGHIELAADMTPARDARIAHWHLLDSDMALNMFHVHHWRNRHGSMAAHETHNLYQGGKTPEQVAAAVFPQEMRDQFTNLINITTYSNDWQFAPRPSLMLFQRDSVMLGIGARDLPHGFGLELQAAAGTLQLLRYNYGDEYGMAVAAGTTSSAPRTYLWLDHHGDIWDSVTHYVEMLQEDGEVPRRSQRDIPHWWLRPAYCTWNDQGYLSDNAAFYNFPGDNFKGKDPVEAFDATMLDHLLDILEEERYPFGTVIIDAGWQKARGDWLPHPERFPDLRKQIDRIHAMDMHAVLWLAPFDFHADADICARSEWLCGGGVLGRHGMPMIDFSNPQVQREYIEPLARFLFSNEPDCLDADGLKLDFMADKVHPVFPVFDPDWRGEERFAIAWQSLMYRLLKKWKSDGQMLGAAAHPHFIGCQDLVRTYDVPASQSQHVCRAEMIRRFNPGNLVAIDLCETKSFADVKEHLDIAFRHNLLYECGRVAPDPKTGEFVLGVEYPEFLRQKLRAW